MIFFHDSRHQWSLGPAVIWSTLHSQMPSTHLWNKQTNRHLRPTFWYHSQHPSCIPISFSSSTFILIFPRHVLNLLFSHFSLYPQYYLRCLCEDDYCMIKKAELDRMWENAVVACSRILYCHCLQGLRENEKSQPGQSVWIQNVPPKKGRRDAYLSLPFRHMMCDRWWPDVIGIKSKKV